MKKIYTLAVLAAFTFSSLAQGVVPNPQKKSLKSETLQWVPKNTPSNHTSVNRATLIEEWVSYDRALSAFQGGTPAITSMVNGAVTNGDNVHQQYEFNGTVSTDTAFIGGAYSIIDLGGEFYAQDIFNNNIQPFDVNEPITIDSVFSRFIYKKVDFNVVDTLVVRFSVPSGTHLIDVFGYNAPYNTHPFGDTILFLKTEYNPTLKQIENTVGEFRLPLTDSFLMDTNTRFASDTTQFAAIITGAVTLAGHFGLLTSEVSIDYARQYTSADTMGVNANWFAPVYEMADATSVPFYSPGEWTSGGVLYRGETIYSPHWFGNSDQRITETGAINTFQAPAANYKITQNNSLNASVNELEAGYTLNVYPNPVNDVVNFSIATEKNLNNVSIKMVDAVGSIVREIEVTGSTSSISTSDLVAGTYRLVLTDGEVSVNKAFIKL